ncbi:MAG: CPBP family intramembrane metalloprotease [Firmicutes bacterium]|nr:CPBP family intramembrane metalloprotease [Bacillota bacterium]
MKNSWKYIKNIIKVLFWPIIFSLGTFFINYVFVSIFNSNEQGTMTNGEFIKYISTIEYQEKLNSYINSKSLVIVLITAIIFIPILYIVFKKYKTTNNFKLKDIFIPITFGITISLIYNIVLFQLNNYLNFTNNFEVSSIPIIIQIICSGILGPILEELVFRGIVYNKLKEFNKSIVSLILTSVIFSIFHNDIVNAIYAFGVSFIFIYLYEKYKTLKAPILMHIFLNTTIILMLNLIIKNYIVFNLYLLIVSIIILLVLKIYLRKDV